MEIYSDANMFGVKSSNPLSASNSSLAIDWLEAVFPDLTEQGTRVENSLVLKAHPYALLDASLALQVRFLLSFRFVTRDFQISPHHRFLLASDPHQRFVPSLP